MNTRTDLDLHINSKIECFSRQRIGERSANRLMQMNRSTVTQNRVLATGFRFDRTICTSNTFIYRKCFVICFRASCDRLTCLEQQTFRGTFERSHPSLTGIDVWDDVRLGLTLQEVSSYEDGLCIAYKFHNYSNEVGLRFKIENTQLESNLRER